MSYLSNEASPEVVVYGTGSGLAQTIQVRRHSLSSDEPVSSGGSDTGPTPYDLLLSALGSCTSMTIGLYARRKGWAVAGIEVRLRHSKIYAADCAECETRDGHIDRIERDILLSGDLSDDQRAKLREIADKCPVHRTLKSEVDIRTRLA
jgi:putative redox protein